MQLPRRMKINWLLLVNGWSWFQHDIRGGLLICKSRDNAPKVETLQEAKGGTKFSNFLNVNAHYLQLKRVQAGSLQ